MKILLVGGTFTTTKNEDGTYGKASGLISKLADALYTHNKMNSKFETIDVVNGGDYNALNAILDSTPNYAMVFWFANVDNDLPKIRDVKAVAPRTSSTFLVERLKSRAFSSSSRLFMFFVTAGCVIFRIRAAFAKLSVSATVKKHSN